MTPASGGRPGIGGQVVPAVSATASVLKPIVSLHAPEELTASLGALDFPVHFTIFASKHATRIDHAGPVSLRQLVKLIEQESPSGSQRASCAY